MTPHHRAVSGASPRVRGGLLSAIFAATVAGAFGQALAGPAPAGPSDIGGRLAALEQACQGARSRFFEEYRAAKPGVKGDGEVKAALGRYRAVIDRTATEALGLARAHPRDPVAIDALRFVVDAGQKGQLGDLRPNLLEAEALAILRRDHALAPGMGMFCQSILLNSEDPVAESLIREVLDRHPSRQDRGLACHALAELRRCQAQEIRWLRGKPEDRAEFEKYHGEALKTLEEVRGKDVMARFLANDPAALDAEADTILKRVIAEFGDIPLPEGNRFKTLADRAEAELFQRHGLAIGKAAPEIEGRDHEGKAFRLSDYRGKVVLLTFSGNWCGPCRRLYPEERRLVERFKGKPFALLSVNTDDEVATLRKSIESGEINWRCWWDGHVGPIADRWGILQFPTLFLIDGDGVIRAKPGHQSKTLGDEIDALLARGPAKPMP